MTSMINEINKKDYKCMEDKEILKWLEKTIEFKSQVIATKKLHSTIYIERSVEQLETDSTILQAIKKDYENNESMLDSKEIVKWINEKLTSKEPSISVCQTSR